MKRDEFVQVFPSDEEKYPKCPDCWGGRLFFSKYDKLWICSKVAGGWMWCGRKYKKVQK